MNNSDLVMFAQTWNSIGTINAEQIERIVEAEGGEISDGLLADLDTDGLGRALEELRCCNVSVLVRLVDDACQQARELKAGAS